MDPRKDIIMSPMSLILWILLFKIMTERQSFHIYHWMVDMALYHQGGKSTALYSPGITVGVYLIELEVEETTEM
jgi:hypothetical protein